MHEAPVPAIEADPTIPPTLSAIVMKCLEKRPEDRYARGHDLADALIDWVGNDPAARVARVASVSRRLDPAPTPG